MNLSYNRSQFECIRSQVVRLFIIPGVLFLAPSFSESSEAAPETSQIMSAAPLSEQPAIIAAPIQPSELAVDLVANPQLFKYPAGYMHREPIVHQSRCNIFNPDGVLKLTDQNLFKKKAEMDNYYHLQNSEMIAVSTGDKNMRPQNKSIEDSPATKKADREKKVFVRPVH
jgi:hypothetical protein